MKRYPVPGLPVTQVFVQGLAAGETTGCAVQLPVGVESSASACQKHHFKISGSVYVCTS